MYISQLLLALPVLVAAQNQIPFQDKATEWFEKAKSFIPSGVEDPIGAAAATIAGQRIHKFTHANYDQKLKPKSKDPADSPEEWLILVTGGNKTCFGHCDKVDRAFNESIPLLSALPKKRNFGLIDCERQAILCTTWAVPVPSIYYFQVPIPGPQQSQPRTPLYIIPLNMSSVSTGDVARIITNDEYATKEIDANTGLATDKEKYRYDGYFHPINGELKVFGLLDPLGYIMWGFSQIPSFVFMILISLVSRNFMSRRMATNPSFAGGQGAPAAAAAPPPSAARAKPKRA